MNGTETKRLNETNWAAQAQIYAQQMVTKDNAVKLEVLEHLHRNMGVCLQQWLQALVNAPVTEKLVPLLNPDENDDFSGRVIFTREGLDELDDCDIYRELTFHCGPEDKDGALNDSYDGGCYEQLKKIFDDFPKEPFCDGKYTSSLMDVGAAENFHLVELPKGITAQEMWELVKSRLVKAGAIESSDCT